MNKVELQSFWLPRASSTLASDIDFGWDAISLICIVFFAIVVGAMLFFMWRYRRRGEHDPVSLVDHNLSLEIFWTAIPTVIVIWLFWIGFKGYVNASVAPAESIEIRVIAEKWKWTFIYPNGVETYGELRVPKGKPVKLVMSSKDVIHSLFIPEMRVKNDVVPGLYTTLWFETTQLGETTLECTQYCGDSHSNMLAKVYMMELPAWRDWVESAGDPGKGLTPVAFGKKLYGGKGGCLACHSLDGTPMVGPTWKGIWGRTEVLSDGSSVTVDENYVRESILEPAKKVVKGFQPVMPAFKGVLSDREIDALLAFIKEQKG
jgi:cytochrome c oxidase subunit 2